MESAVYCERGLIIICLVLGWPDCFLYCLMKCIPAGLHQPKKNEQRSHWSQFKQDYISYFHSSFGTYQLIYVRKALLIRPGSLSLPFCDTVMIFEPTMWIIISPLHFLSEATWTRSPAEEDPLGFQHRHCTQIPRRQKGKFSFLYLFRCIVSQTQISCWKKTGILHGRRPGLWFKNSMRKRSRFGIC